MISPKNSKDVAKTTKIEGYNTRFRTFLKPELRTPQDAFYGHGAAGIQAAEASGDQMKTNIACKQNPARTEEKKLATWGAEVPEDLVLDEKKLAESLNKENSRKKEEKDDRKRKYNVSYDDNVTQEEMEAYRMKRVHHDDPMKDFL
ncbi:hypothetical protein BVRB_4g089060 [Beta vulgaris subsp. vulgaris]|nr:hypothetical protein BVRB_4g089060 [Beta vulgaris subsp. vulgaris]